MSNKEILDKLLFDLGLEFGIFKTDRVHYFNAFDTARQEGRAEAETKMNLLRNELKHEIMELNVKTADALEGREREQYGYITDGVRIALKAFNSYFPGKEKENQR